MTRERFDSCDAAYDLCSGSGAARFGGRIGRGVGRIAAPIAG
jgi:RES domain-containing protein